jgi:PAS domain S-box-containing protein
MSLADLISGVYHGTTARERAHVTLAEQRMWAMAESPETVSKALASEHTRTQEAWGLAGQALRERESRIRAILDTTVDAIITIDAQGIIESFNLAAERIFGYAAAEVLGQEVSLLMPSPYHEEHHGYLARYLRTGEKRIIGIGREVVGRRKDGTTFPMDLAVSEVRLGDRCLFTGIVRDITERKRAEEDRLRLAAIVESSDDAIIGKTLDGTIVSWNAGAERLYGYTAAAVLGRSIALLVPPEHPNDVPDILAKVQYGESIVHYETMRMTQDGRRLDVSLTVSPIRTRQGTIIGASTIARDITVRKRAACEMQRADRLALVGQLASGLAHEIGTPLNVIAGNAELLRQDLYQQGLPREALTAIIEQTDRITGSSSGCSPSPAHSHSPWSPWRCRSRYRAPCAC